MIKHCYRVVLRTILLAAALATPVHADQHGNPQAAIEAAADAWIKHYLAGDLDALMTLYTDNATVALHGQPMLQGKAAIREYFAPRIGVNKVTFQILPEAMEIYGNRAHLISKYWMTITPQDAQEPAWRDAGRSLLIYHRGEDGRWLLHVDIDQATPDVTFESAPGAVAAAE
ncbi:MAG: SgcJ/EcaC family oxidoreductase [Gammaproteobacteria bacterium]|nr:SgcJ/EcaC family oxidoreductase [Gammaproteobacteria bacterium]NNM00393.1 SgcJ/EcaC family oxidoreductase [Gammaproteobacteria bacterium]